MNVSRDAGERAGTRGAESLRESWESEVQAVWLYQVLAEVETGDRKRLFEALSKDAATRSRARVRALEEAGAPAPGPYAPPFRVRLVAGLVRRFGPRPLLPALAALRVRGLSASSATPSSLEALLAEETGRPAATPSRHIPGEERRHIGASRATAFRAAVFGINDGLVSNTALILGVGGATDDSGFVLLAGAAGLIAGSLSMAAGEYLSVRSQVEMLEKQLAREEFGIGPGDVDSPFAAAISSFLSFAVGAGVPLLPFAVTGGTAALAAGASLALLALFLAGVATSLFTGRGAVRSGLRMAAIGGGAAAVTHLVGRLFGVAIG